MWLLKMNLFILTLIEVSRFIHREILGREEWWNILLCIPSFFCVVQLAVLPFFPDAPRYILIEKGNTEQCKKGALHLMQINAILHNRSSSECHCNDS